MSTQTASSAAQSTDFTASGAVRGHVAHAKGNKIFPPLIFKNRIRNIVSAKPLLAYLHS